MTSTHIHIVARYCRNKGIHARLVFRSFTWNTYKENLWWNCVSKSEALAINADNIDQMVSNILFISISNEDLHYFNHMQHHIGIIFFRKSVRMSLHNFNVLCFNGLADAYTFMDGGTRTFNLMFCTVLNVWNPFIKE